MENTNSSVVASNSTRTNARARFVAFGSFALLGGVLLATTASAQSAPTGVASPSVAAIARASNVRQLVIRDESGANQTLLIEGRVYSAGMSFADSARAEWCTPTRTGFVNCESARPIAGTPGGDPTGYHCESDDGDGWCECKGALDCVALAFSGNCTAPLDCSGGECACTH